MEPFMVVPSRNPVRRRMALRCIRRSRFKDVLGDGPTTDCPDAYSLASCNGNARSEAGSGLISQQYIWHSHMLLTAASPFQGRCASCAAPCLGNLCQR